MILKKLDIIKLEDYSFFCPSNYEQIVVDKISRVIFTKNKIKIGVDSNLPGIWVPKTEKNILELKKIGFTE